MYKFKNQTKNKQTKNTKGQFSRDTFNNLDTFRDFFSNTNPLKTLRVFKGFFLLLFFKNTFPSLFLLFSHLSKSPQAFNIDKGSATITLAHHMCIAHVILERLPKELKQTSAMFPKSSASAVCNTSANAHTYWFSPTFQKCAIR